MAVREKRCGCDCHNQTIEVSQAISGTGTDLVDAPCCDAWPDGTPCRYAILFECFHDWPLICRGVLCGDHPFQTTIDFPFGVTLTIDGNGQYCTVPSPLGLTFPAMEVMRDCATDADGECVFSNRLYGNTDGVFTSMASSYLIDTYPGAVANKFPPYHTTAGGIRYHKADFGRTDCSGCEAGETELNPNKPSCVHPYTGQNLWELRIGTNPATLEWVYDTVIDSMPRFGGVRLETGECAWSPTRVGTGPSPHRPRYVAETTWDLWGRNTMHLQNPEDWPSLKRRICVVALSTGSWDNPCDSHEEQCACCDTGFGTLPFSVVVAGCDRLSGSYTWNLSRQTGAPPYCGVSNPTAPCGWFWTTIGGGGSGCQSGTGPEYSGEVGFLIYCDGTGSNPYNIDLYCYRLDTECWESAGQATITSYECRCDGPFFTFTLPEIGCCCDATAGCDNACCDNTPDPIFVDDGTVEVECALTDDCTFWVGSTPNDFAGYCGPVTVQIYCEGTAGEMGLQIGPDYYGSVPLTCSPFGGSTVITSVSGQPECGGGNNYTITVSG